MALCTAMRPAHTGRLVKASSISKRWRRSCSMFRTSNGGVSQSARHARRSRMTRRSFFQVSAGGAITLPEFQPKSMLHVAEHPVARAKYPVIDVHTHLFGLGRKAAADSPEGKDELTQVAR